MDDAGSLPAQPLFDLTGMTPEDAKDYVLTLTAHLHQAEADLKKAEDEVALWEGRMALADQQGRPDLRSQADFRRAEAADAKTKLQMEVWEFQDGVAKMKKQLLILPMTQRSVDTNALLGALANLGGPLDQVTPVTRRAEADEALAALKRKMAAEK